MPLVPYMVVEGALSPCHPLQDGRMHMVCLRFLWRRSRQRVRCNITEHGQMLAHTSSPNNDSNIPLILFSPERCAMATVAPGRERTDGGRDAIASAIASTVATWQVTKRHRHTWLGPPSTSAAAAGSDRAPQRLPMGITLPTTTAYSPCTGVDTPLMARWALALTLPEAEWMHRALLVLRA